MIKRLFILLFYVVAIAFCVVAAINHMELYNGVLHSDFSSWDTIKISIANILLAMGDLIVFLIVLFSFLGFLIHILNTRRSGKKMIKCVDTIGSYFIIYMVMTLIGAIICYIGNSGFFEFVKEAVTDKNFYLPLLIDVITAIFLLVARLIKRGGVVSGVFVAVGVAIFSFLNFKYFNTTRVDLMTNLRFFLMLGACALAVVPAFIPDLGTVD